MNKKYFIFFISSIIFLAVIITSIVIFAGSGNDNTKNKINEELSFLDTKLLGMINSLNNIPFSNSVLLEQNSIKGQASSSGGQSSQGKEGSESSQSSGGEESASGSDEGSKGGSSGGSSGNSGGSSKNEDYTKYNVKTQNILTNDNIEIDWNYIKNTVQVIYTSWPSIMIDLHSTNVKNEDILSFSNTLDVLIVNVQNEDKKQVLNSLAILYSFIPIYKEQYSEDNDEINISYTKAHIINSYVLLEEDKWDEIQAQITKASEYFGLIINSINEKRNQSSISKTYVLINEMNNVIKLKDKKLFYMKYKNLMESAMNI